MDVIDKIRLVIASDKFHGVKVQDHDVQAILGDAAKSLEYCKEKLPSLMKKVEDLTKTKDEAYAERNKLVCALSKLLPAHLCEHSKDDLEWEADWRNIVCIDGPDGQMTWHIHDDELWMFKHLKNEDAHWDGHDTAEKYRRLNKLSPPEGLCS